MASPFDQNDRRPWYHVTLTTYGAWVHGDHRGFRTRHHRRHVDGDYRSPPPSGEHVKIEHRSNIFLKHDPTAIPRDLRPIAGKALIDRLAECNVFVLSAAVLGQHAHFQAKVEPRRVRETFGLAKKHCWFVLRDHGWKGRLWAKRSHAKRIRERGHHERVYRYILGHADQGAWIWNWKESRDG